MSQRQLGGGTASRSPFQRSLRSLPPLLGRGIDPSPCDQGVIPPWNPRRSAPRGKPRCIYADRQGYVMIMLVLLMTILSIGLMVAVPVWQTQIQREKEEGLIFRGKQYVEAVRIYQLRNPGRFPKNLKELVEQRCIRRLYRDPMTAHGEWNIIFLQERGSRLQQPRPTARARDREAPGERRPTGQPQPFSPQRVLVAPLQALASIQNPQILGVVSSSTRKSIKIYNDQTSYDKWFFFYGQDPNKLPEIVYFGQASKAP